MLEWLDEDGDGTVTLEEFQAGHAERFAEMDANGDGKITPDEFKTPPKPKETRMQRMFRRLDANKDGVVTLDEFEKRSEVKFERFDLNGDKVITTEEMQQVMMRGPHPRKPLQRATGRICRPTRPRVKPSSASSLDSV
ncbi:MAG: EF-hand domain-containing protein [Defluviicoccus sp.]|nr:MAG: EF-hand domain-containing protein [Defluviicoccus sp.]